MFLSENLFSRLWYGIILRMFIFLFQRGLLLLQEHPLLDSFGVYDFNGFFKQE
jgi:hypothetical protein